MEPHSVTSELRAVTVYRAGAVCTRVALLDDAAAAHTRLRVLGLPLALAAFSLRARVIGAAAEVVVLDVRAGFEVELGEEIDLASERTALDQARRERLRLQGLVDRIEREIVELRALQPRFREPPRREPPRAAPVSSMLALVELVDRRFETLAARRRELRRELEDAEESERLHERRLAEASSARRTERARVTRAAIVTLSAAPSSACELAIEYEVGGARWAPSYQLALAPDGRGGKLSMRASIVQRTGEDWKAVMLSLSTASLRRRTELPELRSLRIGRAQPEPRRAGWREPPPGLDALFADYDA
ncbi:MAG TPA: mucoidy inhibitor MuiA family protein, partial [Nannocystaceae bacterium]|nr:mucoidy inhibitor MuiA family protein [Nannocystaceae bacterium]